MSQTKKTWKKPAIVVHGTLSQLTKMGLIPGNKKCKTRSCRYAGS